MLNNINCPVPFQTVHHRLIRTQQAEIAKLKSRLFVEAEQVAHLEKEKGVLQSTLKISGFESMTAQIAQLQEDNERLHSLLDQTSFELMCALWAA